MSSFFSYTCLQKEVYRAKMCNVFVVILGYISSKLCEQWCKQTLKSCRYVDPIRRGNVGFHIILFQMIFFACFLQHMLQELGKQNPNLMRLIQDHQADFLRLINEPIEAGGERYVQ